MTTNELCDKIKKNGIPLGLDAWMPRKITTGSEEEVAWREYTPSWKNSTDPWSSNSLWKTLATSLYGSSLSKAEIEDYCQKVEKELKEKEALEHARMYFG